MKTTAAFAGAAALAFALSSADGAAQTTLYKLVDKNGKVTYSEKPPKDYDGKVIPLHIDPKANTATLPTLPRAAPPAATQRSQERQAPPAGARLAMAQEKLEAARRALAAAEENPRDDEVRWIGNKGGGVRRVPTEAYARRLEALQQAVAEAEEDVRKAEQAR